MVASRAQIITAEWLREHAIYDPKLGVLKRKSPTTKSAAGTVIGKIVPGRPVHCTFWVDGTPVTAKAHRLIWLYIHGSFPPMDLDHIDGDPTNNRIENLRLATDSQNLGNMKKPATNKSGKKGVSWHSGAQKWQAHIRVQGQNSYLGLFHTVEAAHAAYCTAAQDRRGAFARFE